jgi:hypothetical protein
MIKGGEIMKTAFLVFTYEKNGKPKHASKVYLKI